MTVLAIAGAAIACALAGPRRLWRWPVVTLVAIMYGLACVMWYRSEHQLVSLHYGVLALVAGAVLAARIIRR